MKFSDFPDMSLFLQTVVLSILVIAVATCNTMFINNDRETFHLWWKEKLVKHQKASRNYENYCL